jgi:mannose/cellobiose epimerase-like protein (N-acyl-D-glucosamine 2-epimerase family)
VEYADPQRRQRLFDELLTSDAATKYADILVAQHLRGISRYLMFYDPDRHFIPTNVGVDGNVVNLTLDGMNQSRHLYGVVKAYDFTNDAALLAKATKMAEAYLRRFVNQFAAPPYLFEEVTVTDGEIAKPNADQALRIERQAYGLAGLVAYYRTTRDALVLDEIRRLHDGFVSRFHDADRRGFIDRVDPVNGTRTETKSFNSTVYIATAYLLDLADVEPDLGRRHRCLDLLTELADIVVEKFVSHEMDRDGTGFIVENFTADWHPDWRDWQRVNVDGREFSISVVGHNTQVGWFLLEMYERTNLEKYKDSAIATLKSSLNRGFDWKNGGVYNGAKREEKDPSQRWMWGTAKAWWQQAETIQALIQADRLGLLDELRLVDGTGLEALEKTVHFWAKFERPEGGTFAEVDESGLPKIDDFENARKGTYHEAQVADIAFRASSNRT